jgi:hypothetical protein
MVERRGKQRAEWREGGREGGEGETGQVREYVLAVRLLQCRWCYVLCLCQMRAKEGKYLFSALRAGCIPSTALYGTVLHCTVLYCTVLYCTVLYGTALHCTVMYCNVALHCILLYYSQCCTEYCTVLFYPTPHSACAALHCTALHLTCCPPADRQPSGVPLEACPSPSPPP